MRVALLFNPIAGRGRGVRAADGLAEALREGGHAATLQPTRLDPAGATSDPALNEAELLVVVGGDGAVRLTADTAIELDKPLYHFPLGTENLFAREFGMTRSPRQLLHAIERGATRKVDVGRVGMQTFLIMTSLGFDAGVVRELARDRRGGISHLSYVRPILRQLRRWRAPVLDVTVDDEQVVDGRPGFVVVANSRQYASRIDPALRASMTDGLLDAVFFPCRSVPELLRWIVACRLRRQERDPRLVYRRGRRIGLGAEPAEAYQLDGDTPGPDPLVTGLDLSLRPAALRVLLP